MIPILFEKNEAAFADNGICRLRDCLDCVVTEERNGIYECDFTYPVTGANYEMITCGRFIGVTHDESGDVQPFEIVSMSRPIDGIVTFHAVHLSYRQRQMTASGSNINSIDDAFALLKTASPDNPFSYETDITSSAYMAAADGTPRSVRQMLGGVQGSILDAYGGEYEWDKWRVILHSARGRKRDFAIRYGVNLLDYNEDLSYQETFTSCVAFWKGEENTVTAVASLDQDGYNGNDIRVPLDLTDKFEEEPTVADLEAKALAYMQNNATNTPARSIDVNFVRLSEMGEFSAFQDLLRCNLCDTIDVIFPMYNIQASFKIVKTVWNVLKGSYDSMELGKLSKSLSDALGGSGGGGSGGSGGTLDPLTIWNEIKPYVLRENSKIPFGYIDEGSSRTVMTATVPNITELVNGVCCYITNGVATSNTNWTLNVNGLGAKPVYSSMAEATRTTTVFNMAYTMLFVYNEDRVEGGCWDIYYGYDTNTNTIGYQLRTNSMSLPVSDVTGRYRLLFTSPDHTHYVPATTSTSTNATALRDVNQEKIDPFGDIIYYGYTTILEAETNISTAYQWRQNVLVLGYSFNRAGAALNLMPWYPVYVKCTPQEDGSAIIDPTTPYAQILPQTEDGKIYIYLGVAYSATNIELVSHHPVYHYKDGKIRTWVGIAIEAITGTEIANICQ